MQKSKVSARKEEACKKLAIPHSWKWPELHEDTDRQILQKLTSIFEKYSQCLRRIKKSYQRGKKQNSIESTPEAIDVLTPEEVEQRRRIKSWMSVGAQSVIRDLEKDELRLVLIWRATQPPLVKRTILSLVASRSCPAACLSDILSPVKAGWEGLTSLTALGIKKSEVETDFDAFVEYVRGVSPAIDIPAVPKFIPANGNTEPFAGNDGTGDPSNTFKDNQKDCETRTPLATLSVPCKRDNKGGLKPLVHNVVPPIVNVDKYYRYVDITGHTEKTFDENFIQVDTDDSCVVEFVNNKRVSESGSSMPTQHFSIASPVPCVAGLIKRSTTSASNGEAKSQGKKEKRIHNEYKFINIKELKRQKKAKKTKLKKITTLKKQ